MQLPYNRYHKFITQQPSCLLFNLYYFCIQTVQSTARVRVMKFIGTYHHGFRSLHVYTNHIHCSHHVIVIIIVVVAGVTLCTHNNNIYTRRSNKYTHVCISLAAACVSARGPQGFPVGCTHSKPSRGSHTHIYYDPINRIKPDGIYTDDEGVASKTHTHIEHRT